MIIYFYDRGVRYDIEVQEWTKIKDLKRKIASKGISELDYTLEHKGRCLDDEKTILHYGIKDGDTVRFPVPCRKTLGISGNLLTLARNSGSVTKMVVDEESSVRQVKEEAARDAGVSASKVQLRAGGAEMQGRPEAE
ncbi:uncharacterized protein LOC125029787 [Penaeus chinensis]|uniref:uncharacterized protein LOC125029787 n=1 Tax=Penaeus chinensis TaxID=139456 RepID=UPI001FB6794D|nr:uncharacterized protein LOC125029787 [Penaeus chinensis]